MGLLHFMDGTAPAATVLRKGDVLLAVRPCGDQTSLYSTEFPQLAEVKAVLDAIVDAHVVLVVRRSAF